MEFDYENNAIELNMDERRVMHLPETVKLTLSKAPELLTIAEELLRRVDDIDPSVTPYVTEKHQLIGRKLRDGQILRSILSDLSPFAAHNLAEEAAQFLEEHDS